MIAELSVSPASTTTQTIINQVKTSTTIQDGLTKDQELTFNQNPQTTETLPHPTPNHTQQTNQSINQTEEETWGSTPTS